MKELFMLQNRKRAFIATWILLGTVMVVRAIAGLVRLCQAHQ